MSEGIYTSGYGLYNAFDGISVSGKGILNAAGGVNSVGILSDDIAVNGAFVTGRGGSAFDLTKLARYVAHIIDEL